jgi:hypothetical protein
MTQKVFEYWPRGLNPNASIMAAMADNSALSAIFYGISERRVEVLPKPSVHIVGQNLRGRLPEMGISTVGSARAETGKGPKSLKPEQPVGNFGYHLGDV